MLHRRRFLAQTAALLSATALAAPSRAASFPTQQVRLVVPFSPGGANDVVARALASGLGEVWGQPVVIEHKPGAGGNLGTAFVARAPADGHTILSVPMTHAVNRYLYSSLAYDPVADFAPVSLLCTQPNLMVVPTDLPVGTVAEFIAYAKAKGPLAFGSAGYGTSLHLCGELFARTADIALTHIPYKGSAPAVADLMAGRLHCMFNSTGSVLPHVRAGRLRALGVTTAVRTPLAPELPTIAEAALPGFDVFSWWGTFVAARTPEATITALNEAIVAALARPDVRGRLESLGTQIVGSSASTLGAHLRSEMAKWGPIIRAAGIRADA